MAIPLAASMADQPPTATSAIGAPRGAEGATRGAEALRVAVTAAACSTAAAPAAASATAAAPAATSSVLGFGCTPENTRAGMAAPASRAVTMATTGVAASA